MPDHIEPIAILPVGYPAESKSPPKTRKAFNEVVFEEVFGEPLKK